MSKVLVTESHLNNIAEAIRSKNGASTTYRPGDMAAAIQAIPTGITPTGTKNIAQNGTHDVTQYASANVNVRPNLQSKTVTENGTVTPDQGYDGLSSVVVNVSGGGGLTPVMVTPTVHEASFIGSNNTLVVNNSSYPDYRCISIELSQYAGKLIRIVNNGNRNYWGLFFGVMSGQNIRVVNSRQTTDGELIFFADDYIGLPDVNYLVYDYTSTAQSAPLIETYELVL